MTIEEMHINIDLDLQKVNTYTQRNLLPQEIDFFLNNEVSKFIKQRSNPQSNLKQLGTDKTTKRYEDLDDFTKEKDFDIHVEDGVGICTLPSDYYSYIASKTNIYQVCGKETITPTSKTIYQCVFPLSFTINTVLTTYTITLIDSSGSTILFNLSNLPTGYIQNVDINKQSFMLLKGIKVLVPENLENKQSNIYNFYWERYKESFYNNSFILSSTIPFTSISVNINDVVTVYNSEQISQSVYAETSVLWGKNRLIEDEFKFHGQQSNLSKSRPESLNIELNQLVLKVDFPKNTICQKVRLRYISKPTILDLLLKRNLNIKDSVAKEIVSNTVRFIKGIFNGDYQTYLNENTLIE